MENRKIFLFFGFSFDTREIRSREVNKIPLFFEIASKYGNPYKKNK